MDHDFGKTAGSRADDRHSRCQRFKCAEAKGLLVAGQQKEIGAGQQRRNRVDLSEKHHVLGDAELTRFGFSLDALRAVADHHQHRRHVLVDAGKHAHDIAHAFHRSKVGDVHQHFPAPRRLGGDRELVPTAVVMLGIDEVRDHLDVTPHTPERAIRFVAQVVGHRGHAVGFLDGEARDRVERALLADDGDIGAVQRGHHAYIGVPFPQHLARYPGTGRMRDGVVTMQDIELMIAHDLVHAHGECEVIRRILEQRIASDIHLVKPDPRQKTRQAKRLLVRDEVYLVTASGERNTEFSRHGARATVRWVAGDTDLHTVLVCIVKSAMDSAWSHHASARSSASGAPGSIRVTCPAGS